MSDAGSVWLRPTASRLTDWDKTLGRFKVASKMIEDGVKARRKEINAEEVSHDAQTVATLSTGWQRQAQD